MSRIDPADKASESPIPRQHADPRSILVVIPTLNENAHIARTLSDLMAGAPQMAEVDIVVADGGSTDGTIDIVAEQAKRWPNVRLIHNPERLQSAAINLAVETCGAPRHRILVRVDAHSHYPTDYVLRVADSLLEHQSAGLATVMDSVGEGCFQRGAAWAMVTRAGSGGSMHRGGTISGWVDHGHHAGFDLATFRAVGGYNRHFVANEDAELDHRIGLHGGRIWLDATIRLEYYMRTNPVRLARQYWRYGRGRAQTVRTHDLRPRLRQMIPPALVLAFAICLFALPFTAMALVLPGLYLAVLAWLSLAAMLRHRSVCVIWVGPALTCMHMAWGAGFLYEITMGSGHGD